jgi:Protein of unknown function (DUF3363)
MHQAVRRTGREPDVRSFALHGDQPDVPIVGLLVERGLQDELKGIAYAIVEGIDGRTHHLRFADLNAGRYRAMAVTSERLVSLMRGLEAALWQGETAQRVAVDALGFIGHNVHFPARP